MDDEEQRVTSEFEDDPLYDDSRSEDASENDVRSGTIFASLLNALPPGCLTALVPLVGCLVVALTLIRR